MKLRLFLTYALGLAGGVCAAFGDVNNDIRLSVACWTTAVVASLLGMVGKKS
jgi:hypothetical protein